MLGELVLANQREAPYQSASTLPLLFPPFPLLLPLPLPLRDPPSPPPEPCTARLRARHPADDVVNPPELGIMEKLMPRVKHGRYILLPTTEATRGHGTHSLPKIWGRHLADFMRELTPAPSQ